MVEHGQAAAAYQDRQRQARDLEHIETYYTLGSRIGVRVAVGLRVRHGNREGTIVDTAGQYLLVLHDGEERASTCHPTSNMEYATDTGWVRATPKPDPNNTAPAGAAPSAITTASSRDDEPVSDGSMRCPVPAPETGHPCTKLIPKGWTAAEGHGGGHFWQAPAVTELQARGAHYDAGSLLSGQSTPWHLPENCTPDCWKWGDR